MIESVDISSLKKQLGQWRASGETIGFVPTMGFLHEGHLSLVRLAQERGDRVVISIFVNPTQFGPEEDLEQYPRDLEGDRQKLIDVGADLLFLPSVELLYPTGSQTFVEVSELSEPLCGRERPTHFRGVATIVTKFLNLIQPDFMVLGEKDFQQLAMLRQMAKDLCMDTEILGGMTVREPDGLALSSRNAYLDLAERQAATCLSRAIRCARACFANGERQADKLVQAALEVIEQTELASVQYLELCDATKLEQVSGDVCETDRLFFAVHVGQTRLIDNAPVGGVYPL